MQLGGIQMNARIHRYRCYIHGRNHGLNAGYTGYSPARGDDKIYRQYSHQSHFEGIYDESTQDIKLTEKDGTYR